MFSLWAAMQSRAKQAKAAQCGEGLSSAGARPCSRERHAPPTAHGEPLPAERRRQRGGKRARGPSRGRGQQA